MRVFPELTFIPIEFANSKMSNLTLWLNEKEVKHPKIKDPFFILWIPLNLSEEFLINSIQKVLPDFPVKKSITCTIYIAYPRKFVEEHLEKEIDLESKSLILGKTIAKIIPSSKIMDYLADFNLIPTESYQNLECSSSMYFWSLLVKLTLQLIAKGSYIPRVVRMEVNKTEKDYFEEKVGTFKTQWIPILKSERDINNFIRIMDYAPLSAYNIPINEMVEEIKGTSLPDDLKEFFFLDSSIVVVCEIWSISKLSRVFIYQVLDEIVRGSTSLPIQTINREVPWELRLIHSLVGDSSQIDYFNIKEEIIPEIFNLWSQRLNLTWDIDYTLTLLLNAPDNDDTNNFWSLEFSLQSLLGDSNHYSLEEFWKLLKNNEIQHKIQKTDIINLRGYVIKSLNMLSEIFEPISSALKQKYPYKIQIPSNKIIPLLQSGLDEIRSYGFSIAIPENFSYGGSQRVQPVLEIKSGEPEISGNIPLEHTSFDISSILKYEWVLKIGNSTLTDEESVQILENSGDESLLFWKNQWIMIDNSEVNQFKYGKKLHGTIKGLEALKLALTQNAFFESSDTQKVGPYPVKFYGPLDDVLKIIQGKAKVPHLPQPSSFNGKLRKYQEYGFNWMKILTSIGFGVVLADDMGLGKTIQVIALILSIIQNPNTNHNFLVICPTSVLGNWIREIKRFADSIHVKLHYGPNRVKTVSQLDQLLQKNDVILTSYNLLRRDIELFEIAKWEAIILDESQNIKNYKTKQARAVYRLVDNVRRKIALSGTPIENRITELWSLYHFINPFLLGNRTQFMKKYAIPVGRLGNEKLTMELRNLVNPFLLRRMKTNKEIMPELPDKQIIDVYITLTENQKTLYTKVVDEMLRKVEALGENSIQKFKQKGLILTAIMQLKQICNHPDQYLHTNLYDVKKEDVSDFISRSGKLQRFIELLEEAIASRNKVLIFTQFKVMGDFIQHIIENYYNFDVPFIHGAVPQEKRTKIVNQFQEDSSYQNPMLLLSLRAGGVGLNLSKASVVIHYDLWWNPAVIDQATDRAYRIGQENKVFVYKLIADDTIEEHINKMLKEKRAIAESIIEVTGEEWITQLSFGELKEMFQLREVDD